MPSDKRRVRIRLSYDGTHFFGWQKQPEQPMTIQGVLEKTLSRIYNQPIAVVGSGRTDRGVHAINQWAHCDLPGDRSHRQLACQIQSMTPDAIRIKSVETAPGEFHARISALSKCYIYRLQVSGKPNPFTRYWSWQRPGTPDLEYLNETSRLLLGEHDFASFRSRGTELHHTVRELQISQWIQKKPDLFIYQIRGTGFLKQMVRNIVGTLMNHHDRGLPPSAILEVLRHKDRQQAAPPAPACGLFLRSVQYPKDLDNKCRKL